MKYTLRNYQQAASDAAIRFFQSNNDRNGLMILPTGCHAKGSKVLIWNDEPRKVEDIKVGDLLVGSDGNPTKVINLHHGTDELYKITPIKGDPFIVNGGHILSLHKTNEGKGSPCCKSRIDEISVKDYVGKSKYYKHLHKLWRVHEVHFDSKEPLPLDPYLYGLILGDGSTSGGVVCITTMRTEVRDFLYQYAQEYGMKVTPHPKNGGQNKAITYCLRSVSGGMYQNEVLNILKDYDLIKCTAGNKYIPTVFKVSSRADRFELLAGLLDTDAFYDDSRRMYEYCSKSRQLAEDVVFLCRSLGFYAKIGKTKIVKGEKYYRICITGPLSQIPTKVKIRQGTDRVQKKSLFVTGFTVEKIGFGEYYGFEVEGNHLYCDEQFFVHHNSGKSLIIADIAHRLDDNVLVFQPSKEILAQNYNKLLSYGETDCSIYSASFKSKEISKITFATIGSVKSHMEDFNHFKYVIIDEAHGVNSVGGMYKDFFDCAKRKILGLTATPYRLSASQLYIDAEGRVVYPPKDEEKAREFEEKVWKGEIAIENKCILKFLTRTRPRIFHDVIYNIDVGYLLQQGYLAKLNYYDVSILDQRNLKRNSTGMDFDEKGLFKEFQESNLQQHLVDIVQRLLSPKRGGPRKGILVFTRFLEESENLCKAIPGCAMVSGDTPAKERDRILNDFKDGKIKVLSNVGILTTGYDYPELDTVVIARPTMSLALYYQIVGRAIRPHPNKEAAWIVDLAGNIKRFGKVENLWFNDPGSGKYVINGIVDGQPKVLTNEWF